MFTDSSQEEISAFQSNSHHKSEYCPCESSFTNATYTDNLATITLAFDHPIPHNFTSAFLCTNIFTETTTKLIGESSTCSFSNNTHLIVNPTNAPPLGTEICIHEGTLTCASPLSSCTESFVSGCQKLSSASAVIPRAILVASEFSSCSDLFIDGSQSSGGTNGMKYNWNVEIDSNATQVESSVFDSNQNTRPTWLTKLQEFFRTQDTATLLMVRTHPLVQNIPINTPLAVTLRITNILGLSSNQTKVIQKVTAQKPIIRSGFTQDTLMASKQTMLSATAQTELCDGSIIVTAVEWELLANPPLTLETLNITQLQSIQRIIVIPPNALRPYIGKQIEIVCRATNSKGLTSEWHKVVDVVAAPLSVALVGVGTSVQRARSHSIILKIQDPDELHFDSNNIEWTCADRKTQLSCLSPNSLSPDSLLFDAQSLENGIYDISVSVWKGNASYTSSGWFEVVDGSPLTVSVAADGNLRNFNRALNLTLSCLVVADNSTQSIEQSLQYTYDWSITGGFVDVRKSVVFSASHDTIQLIGSHLTAGVTYIIKVSVKEESSGRTGFRIVTLYTTLPPLRGRLQVIPGSGVAMSTTFRFVTSEWEGLEDTYPFLYEFSYVRNDGIRTLLLESREISTQTMLPAGNVTVIIRVTNAFGCSSEAFFVVSVRSENDALSSWSAVNRIMQTDYQATRNSMDLYRQLMISQLILDSIDSPQNSTNLRRNKPTLPDDEDSDNIVFKILRDSLDSWKLLLKSEGIVWSISGILQRCMRLAKKTLANDTILLTQLSSEVVKMGRNMQKSKGKITNAFLRNMEVFYESALSRGAKSMQSSSDTLEDQIGKLLVGSGIEQISMLQEIQSAIVVCGESAGVHDYGVAVSNSSSASGGIFSSELGSVRLTSDASGLSTASCIRGVLSSLSGSLTTGATLETSQRPIELASNSSFMGFTFISGSPLLSKMNTEKNTGCLEFTFPSDSFKHVNYSCMLFNSTAWTWSAIEPSHVNDTHNATATVYCPCPHNTPVRISLKSTNFESAEQNQEESNDSAPIPTSNPVTMAIAVCVVVISGLGLAYTLHQRARKKRIALTLTNAQPESTNTANILASNMVQRKNRLIESALDSSDSLSESATSPTSRASSSPLPPLPSLPRSLSELQVAVDQLHSQSPQSASPQNGIPSTQPSWIPQPHQNVIVSAARPEPLDDLDVIEIVEEDQLVPIGITIPSPPSPVVSLPLPPPPRQQSAALTQEKHEDAIALSVSHESIMPRGATILERFYVAIGKTDSHSRANHSTVLVRTSEKQIRVMDEAFE